MENYNIKGRDIVIVGLTPYEFDPDSNILNLAFELAKNNRVLFINRPTDRYSLVKGKEDPVIQRRMQVLRGKEPDLRQVTENFWNLYPKTVLESVNWLAVDFAFDYLNKVNNKRFARQINAAIQKLNFRDIILINDNDFYRTYYLEEYLKPDVFIYYLRDYLLHVDYWKKHGSRLEKSLLKKADMVLAATKPLTRYALNFNPQTVYVGTGCDNIFDFDKQAELEDSHKTPDLLQDLPSPVIGYAGKTSSQHFDSEFVLELAEELKTASFVVVSTDLQELPHPQFALMKNIFFTNASSRLELSSFVRSFNACFIPKTDQSGGYDPFPKSVFEFLAAGKPVVTFENTILKDIEKLIYMAEDNAGFTDLLIQAVKEKDPALQRKRKEYVSSCIWRRNVNEIYKAMAKSGIKSGSSTRGKEVVAE